MTMSLFVLFFGIVIDLHILAPKELKYDIPLNSIGSTVQEHGTSVGMTTI